MDFTLWLAAFGIGFSAGLRSMSAPALVSWCAHLGHLRLEGSALAFLGRAPAVAVLTLGAVGELIADKFPWIPSRITAGPLIFRFITGAVCGSALFISSGHSPATGMALGGLGAIAGAFGGYHARRSLVVKSGVPDLVVALLEDAIAIGGALLLLRAVA